MPDFYSPPSAEGKSLAKRSLPLLSTTPILKGGGKKGPPSNAGTNSPTPTDKEDALVATTVVRGSLRWMRDGRPRLVEPTSATRVEPQRRLFEVRLRLATVIACGGCGPAAAGGPLPSVANASLLWGFARRATRVAVRHGTGNPRRGGALWAEVRRAT